MHTVTLTRWGSTPMGTFGELRAPEFRCYTVEPPWRGNARYLSCIPPGVYRLELGSYHVGGYPAYELVGVPGRDLIKIHAANRARELLGCIAVGNDLACINGEWAVLNSRRTLKRLHAVLARMESKGLAPAIRIDWRVISERLEYA